MKDTKEKVYNYCKEYISKHGYAPAISEIAEGVGLKSKSSAYFYFQDLLDEGIFETDHPGSPRAFRIVK